jgi:sugar phosphate isomerase/epimerase
MLQCLGLDLGVMQGRLLPKYKGRFQAHPVNYWQSEFTLAKELGFTHIEFILDYNEVFDNPLLTASGVQEIKKYINDTGVRVRSICADYFMEAPLHSMNDELAKNSLSLMIKLMHSVAPLGTECIVLPCVDQSSVKTETEKEKLIKVLQQLNKTCEELNITIDLITRLSPSHHDYPTFSIELIPFVANYLDGEIKLAEHKQYLLLEKEDLAKLDWAEADIPVLTEFLKL